MRNHLCCKIFQLKHLFLANVSSANMEWVGFMTYRQTPACFGLTFEDLSCHQYSHWIIRFCTVRWPNSSCYSISWRHCTRLNAVLLLIVCVFVSCETAGCVTNCSSGIINFSLTCGFHSQNHYLASSTRNLSPVQVKFSMYPPALQLMRSQTGLHTARKFGRRRPMEYLAMSVIDWLAAAPNA